MIGKFFKPLFFLFQCQLFLYKPSDFNQSDPVNFYYYPSHEFPESEPDTIAEEDAEQESADSGYVEDQQPDEDYDNYDSERTLQIVEEDNEGGASSGDKSDQAKSKVSKNRKLQRSKKPTNPVKSPIFYIRVIFTS